MNSRRFVALGCSLLLVLVACHKHQPSATAGEVRGVPSPATSSLGRNTPSAVGTKRIGDSPEAVAKVYLDAYLHGPARLEYECLTSADRAAVSLEYFEEQRKGIPDPPGVQATLWVPAYSPAEEASA